ncbi:MAG: hypothetical protein P1Q69_18615 [Candidatus Thorarchaeota archaeon]|nr:hypothetical protein [Candidatus Thorarchaeota archaeon]
MPQTVVAEPTGVVANQGTIYPGNYYAFTKVGYSTTIWNPVTVDETQGDYYVHGHSVAGSYYIDYYVVIKVQPQDKGLTNIEIKVASSFYYGISAGFLSSASWELQYVILDMTQNPLPIGWSQYEYGDSVSWGAKNYRSYTTPSGTWYPIYDTLFWRDYEEINPYGWTYVGVWIRCALSNSADFYRTSSQQGW